MIDDAQRVADEVLAPVAEEVDAADRVPAGHLDALAQLGLFDLGSSDASTARRVIASIAGGCGATAFVWVQHHGVVRLVAGECGDDGRPKRSMLLDDLVTGRQLAGTAFAHVRRPGAPAIRATEIADGWRLDGRAPWATSWGIADVFSIAAETDDGRLVWSLLDIGPDRALDGVTAHRLSLPVLGATRTVALTFDRVVVRADQVVSIDDAATWRRSDRLRSAAGSPAPLGIAERVDRLLRVHDDDSVVVADELRDAIAELWSEDDDLVEAAASIGTGSSPMDVDEVVELGARHRARVVAAARAGAAALVAATGGRGMESTSPAQRLAREAEFFLVQAQTRDGRRASLEHLAHELRWLAGRGSRA